ncbi:MAG: hypothetical protein QXD23_00205 [Candidatus Micrarchaeaceae archaeon]
MSKTMKGQSAIEFLTTYGWAIIILIIVLAFVVYLLTSLNTVVPNTCTFNSGFSCTDFLVETNSLSSTVLMLLSNNQNYPITSATAVVNLSSIGTVVAHCLPTYVIPGGDILCTGTTSNIIGNNVDLSGKATVNASECISISNPVACTQKYNINYTATLNTKTTTYANNICSISLSFTTGTITGVQYPLSAEVTLNGNPISGATVNFSSSSNYLSITPHYENTVDNGTATTHIFAEASGSYTVTAKFYTCSVSSTFSFSKLTTNQKLIFVPIKIINNENSVTQPNFQDQLSFNPNTYFSYEKQNLSNIEFTLNEPYGISGSVPLYSWIESGASSTATKSIVWVNLGSQTLGPVDTNLNNITIYMNFLPNNSPVTSGYTGYAPQLYCSDGCSQISYGQYDNGGKVFNFYDNFAGTSLDSNWQTYTSTSYPPNVFVSNGLTFTTNDVSSGGADLYTSNKVYFVGNTLDFYGYIGAQATGGYSEQGFGFGSYPQGASDTGFVVQGISSLSGSSFFYVGGPDFYATTQRQLTSLQTNTGLGIWTVSIFNGNIISYYNYLDTGSIQEPTSTSSQLSMAIAAQANSGYPNNPTFLQWFRMRQTPPNGVMPQNIFGTVSST